MAKPKASPRFKSPQALFSVPPFISQSEVLNVLRLRSNLHVIRLELEEVQSLLLEKLGRSAATEAGPHLCAEINGSLAIWEDTEYAGATWRRVKTSEVLA